MEALLQNIDGFQFSIEEVIDALIFLITDSVEVLIAVIAVLLIFAVSVWMIYARLEEKGWKCLIPIYRWVVLFRAVGITPCLSILMLIPGVNLIMVVVLCFYLARAYQRSYFFVVGLLLLPIIFLPILAFGEGKCIHYQPHARFVDLPVAQEKENQVKRKVDTKWASETVRQTHRPKQRMPARKISVIDLDEKAAQPKAIVTTDRPPAPKKSRRYMDIAAPRQRLAKPLREVAAFRPKRRASESGKNPRRPSKPIPGEIRPMKQQIVVVGDLEKKRSNGQSGKKTEVKVEPYRTELLMHQKKK